MVVGASGESAIGGSGWLSQLHLPAAHTFRLSQLAIATEEQHKLAHLHSSSLASASFMINHLNLVQTNLADAVRIATQLPQNKDVRRMFNPRQACLLASQSPSSMSLAYTLQLTASYLKFQSTV